MRKRIVVFANSDKNNAHCLAGKDIRTKEWIRPVTDEYGGAIPEEKAKMKNPHGIFNIKKLSKIDVSLDRRVPLPNQPENILIGDGECTQNYNIDFGEIEEYIDLPDILWCNNSSSSIGKNDRILFDMIKNGTIKIEQSLYLIKISELLITDSNDYSRRRERAFFTYNNYDYRLVITDPFFKKDFYEYSNKTFIISGDIYLCISLGNVYDDGYCYKLVAGIHYDKNRIKIIEC